MSSTSGHAQENNACGEAKICVDTVAARKCNAMRKEFWKVSKEANNARADQHRCEGREDSNKEYIEKMEIDRTAFLREAERANAQAIQLEKDLLDSKSSWSFLAWIGVGVVGTAIIYGAILVLFK